MIHWLQFYNVDLFILIHLVLSYRKLLTASNEIFSDEINQITPYPPPFAVLFGSLVDVSHYPLLPVFLPPLLRPQASPVPLVFPSFATQMSYKRSDSILNPKSMGLHLSRQVRWCFSLHHHYKWWWQTRLPLSACATIQDPIGSVAMQGRHTA